MSARSVANALVVSSVEPDSPAACAGVLPGDGVTDIDGKPVSDILDYRFYSAVPSFRLGIVRAGQPMAFTVRPAEGEDPGLLFTEDLGDGIHKCVNRCLFCFIHQMPKGMRRSLYLTDDDFRLSFIHGNYITLTNLTDEEWDRILEQRLSPLYVSVHATDPFLRGQLIGRRSPAPIIEQLRRLAEGRIDTHVQVVLCPGLNDGDALSRTLADLATLHPSVSGLRCGVQSVAIVPVGLTRFRAKLPSLVAADAPCARSMISTIKRAAVRFEHSLGTRFVWLSDEWYWLAGQTVPGSRHYEDFPQLDDGVGTTRLFLDDLRRLKRRLPEASPIPISATLLTAELPADSIRKLVDTLNQIAGVSLRLRVVPNRYFGGGINIAGLLTGTDIGASLMEDGEHGTVFIPEICLRDGEVFLDDVTLGDLRQRTGADIRIAERTPATFAESLGLLRPSRAHTR